MKASSSDISACEWIDLLIAKAPELRRAGVVELSRDRVVFAPHREQPVAPADDGPEDETEGIDSLNDPVGMGFPPGTEIPSLIRRTRKPNE